MTALRIGMGDSYGLRLTVASSTDFNPSLPTAATIEIRKPEGDLITWTGVIESQSASTILVRYTFNANGTDLDQDGQWRVWIQWTVVGETPGPRTEVGTFDVIAANAL